VKERIQAVQRVFWAVLLVALAVILLGIPMGDDGENMAVLDELTAFHAAFEQNRPVIESTLLSHARQAGALPLDALAERIAGEGVPKVSAEKGAQPVQPRVLLDVSSLARIQALSQPNATLTIASVRPSEMAQALAWRLSRAAQPNTKYTLKSVELTDQRASEADAARELEADKLRVELRDAERDLKNQTAAYEKIDELYESRRKWRATWKVLQRTNEERLETKAKLDQAQKKRDQLSAAYEKLALEGGKLEGVRETDTGKPGDTQYAIAVARLASSAGGEPLSLRFAVPLDVKAAPVSSLVGAELPITAASEIWPHIQNGTGEEAIAKVRSRFSWHYAYVEVGGIKIGGMTLVQLAPLALVPCLMLLIRRSRRVGSSYNPFDRDAASLPSVGLGVSPLNIVVLVLLPLAGSVLCAISLVQLRHLPLVPMAVALACIGLGVAAHVSLRELMDLRDAVRRSHSHPPPAAA
jgi:hypothetical protein